MCVGSLKGGGLGNRKHMWVMRIETNLQDITFFDPMINESFFLKGRIKNSEILRKYFTGDISSKSDIENYLKNIDQSIEIKNENINPKKNKNQVNRNARILNQEMDIEKNLIIQDASDIIKDMELIDTYINIKQGTKYRLSIDQKKAYEEFLRSNGLKQKNKSGDDDSEEKIKLNEFSLNESKDIKNYIFASLLLW